MKIEIKVQPEREETEVLILCQDKSKEIDRLYYHIRQFSDSITCYQERQQRQLPLYQIFYFETVEGKNFVYTKNEIYQCRENLSALETVIEKHNFSRISRNVIVNVKKIQCVETYKNHRLLLTMKNGEKLLVGRTYLSELKRAVSQL